MNRVTTTTTSIHGALNLTPRVNHSDTYTAIHLEDTERLAVDVILFFENLTEAIQFGEAIVNAARQASHDAEIALEVAA